MLGITIKKTDGTLWAATQITATRDEDGNPCVSLLCAGMMRIFRMTEVEEITARMPQVMDAQPEPKPAEEVAS